MDHLPECGAPDHALSQKWEQTYCICDRLRDCETRVREETFDADWSEMGQLAAAGIFRRQAYLAALDAARDAVESLSPRYDGEWRIKYTDALAAIDALKEKP